MLIGYARVSKADGSQLLDLQRDALIDAGVADQRIYEDRASGRKDHRPGLECGHIDAGNRKGKMFRCMACGRVDDADVNAAKVMRQRGLRWLALKSAGHSNREAAETLWKALRTARKESKRWGADRAEAPTEARSRSHHQASTRWPRPGSASSRCAPVRRNGRRLQANETALKRTHHTLSGGCVNYI